MSQSLKQQPYKVHSRAQIFSKTFSKQFQQPVSNYKKAQIKDLAQYKKETVRIAIQQGKFQQELYRDLQKIDIQKRNDIAKIIQQKEQRVDKNIVVLDQKHDKKSQKYNQHCKKVYEKFIQDERKKKNKKDEQAINLRKQLLDFYQKQRNRKLKASNAQVKVSTCYQNAIDRLEDIHRKNVAYADKAGRQLSMQLNRNNHHDQVIQNKIRASSVANKNKQKIYENCQENLEQKQKAFIQTYCKDLDQSIKAFRHKGEQNDKSKKRLAQFFKTRFEKWNECKKRVDDQKEIVPQKCLDILDKTTRSSFRQTVSSFRSSAREWTNRVQHNKSEIKYRDDMRRDNIMQNHNDLRLRNTTSFRINEKMDSMRGHAKKMAYHHL